MNLKQDIQNVIATLETLDIKPTYDNMSKLLGCMQVLANVRDRLNEQEEKDGTADSE